MLVSQLMRPGSVQYEDPLHSNPDHLDEPRAAVKTVLLAALAGLIPTIVSFLVGIITEAQTTGHMGLISRVYVTFKPHEADGPRLLMCALGLITTGAAISMNPRLWQGWLVMAINALLCYGVYGERIPGHDWHENPYETWFAAIPNSWDSLQLFALGLVVFSILGFVFTCIPRKVGIALATICMLYHFLGILSAVMTPPPTPWLASMYWVNVSRPYLHYMYLNNAYQFYSPDPGPATELWVLAEFGDPDVKPDPDEKRDTKWLKIPSRDGTTHFNDPLGMSYFRRLSITENVAFPNPNYPSNSDEVGAINQRRYSPSNKIPRDNNYMDNYAFGGPTDPELYQVMPSYVNCIIKEYSRREGKEIRRISVYRARHNIPTAEQYYGIWNEAKKERVKSYAFEPGTFFISFRGTYNHKGELENKDDPMLYWHIPVLPIPGKEYGKMADYSKFDEYYMNYLKIHANTETSPRIGANP